MNKRINEISDRYYRGESTLEEERELRAAYRNGQLQDDPALAIGTELQELPEGLIHNIQCRIKQRQKHSRHLRWYSLSGIAALLILIISIPGVLPRHNHLQLSDNTKKERFEEALRVIGIVLEEKSCPKEKILYEDDRLIIVTQ